MNINNNKSVIFNWKLFVISASLIPLTLIINLKYPILPVNTLTFIITCVTVWFISMYITFVALHKLLQNTTPFELKILHKATVTEANNIKLLKPNKDSVKNLTADIDRYFISKWYTIITSDDEFLKESRVFLDEVISRFVEIELHINNKVLLHAFLNIYLRHLKEFRRSLKRKDKYHVDVTEVYRYFHSCSNNNKLKDYFLYQLTENILKCFVDSDLWNSLPYYILVSILSKKLVLYLLKLSSDPEVLNYVLLNAICGESAKNKLQLNKYSRISLTQYFDVQDGKLKQSTKESTEVIKQNGVEDHKTNGVLNDQREINKESTEGVDEVDNITEGVDEVDNSISEVTVKNNKEGFGNVSYRIEDQPVMRRRNVGNYEQNIQLAATGKFYQPVKIYEPKTTSSKTWRDSRDLACVSLGQDPLDVLELLGATGDARKLSVSEQSVKTTMEVKEDSPSLFSEVMQITSMEGLKSSIKPISDATERTLHNIKDLQETTVHNALHKIGDFQVNVNNTTINSYDQQFCVHCIPNTLLFSSLLTQIHRHNLQQEDEAAGVVEGIFDFGMAGFRKGLRLTGLQDNIENAKATLSHGISNVKKKPSKLRRSDSSEKLSSAEDAESVWVNPIPMVDSPTVERNILMDSTPLENEFDFKKTEKVEKIPIPSISMEQSTTCNSPDPEYEDTADLASSIAKLRSLLQQRSSESSLSTPAASPMPDDYLQRPSGSESVLDMEDTVDRALPNFYKFCQKTASGVLHNTLNTIKTALPGNNLENLSNVDKWKFKSDMKESEVLIRIKKLLTERKDYCLLNRDIDAAYEAIDSLDSVQQNSTLLTNLQFEDELDDFEVKIPITKALIDVLCELFAYSNTPLLQEPVVKMILLIFGNTIETIILSKIESFREHLADHLIKIPDKSNTNTLAMDMEDYVKEILKAVPDVLKLLMGEEVLLKALTLFVSSMQIHKINQDVVLQAFELFVMKIIEENNNISPPASA